MEEVHGVVESIVFSSDESGFTVARLKEPKKKELTCIVGAMPSLQPGETLSCSGTWKQHREHGLQFEVKTFMTKAPADIAGIQKYLESGLIKGIGPVYAKRIVKMFGTETLSVIDADPSCLLEVPGIGKKRAEYIGICWKEQRAIREVMIFLRSHNIAPSYAQKIFKRYGDESIKRVTENPFALAKEIFGIGFKTADTIATNIGIAKDAPLRIEAAIAHILWEESGNGHVCFPKEELIAHVATLLEVDPKKVEEGVLSLIENQEIIEEEKKIWIKPLYLSEIGIAREIARLSHAPCNLREVAVDKALLWVQEKLSIDLAEEQSDAVAKAMEEKIQIITGGPGTGKSTITKAILTITEKLSSKIILAAPTGRAAKRMSEITRKKASTIHSLLEMSFQAGKFKRDRDNPLECDLIIVDEASMIDTQLMYHFLKAVPDRARVIFVGDIDQLPSVGPGNVLNDLIASETIAVTTLKQIFRQAAGSKIITNAHKINNGEFPDLYTSSKSDFLFFYKETPEEIEEALITIISRLPRTHRLHKLDQIQVLSPMKRGIIGTENLNSSLQKTLNPLCQTATPLTRMGRNFLVGDKVMQIRNNYQKHVYNGDVGKISAIDMVEQQISITFDGKLVTYEFSEIDELVLAYAISIHKYQGSECPCVIIPIHTSHFKLLHRNLLYTGITRGKKLVILIGTKKAIAIAVRNNEIQGRHTGLETALKNFIP